MFAVCENRIHDRHHNNQCCDRRANAFSNYIYNYTLSIFKIIQGCDNNFSCGIGTTSAGFDKTKVFDVS